MCHQNKNYLTFPNYFLYFFHLTINKKSNATNLIVFLKLPSCKYSFVPTIKLFNYTITDLSKVFKIIIHFKP